MTDRARSVCLGRALIGIQSYAELIRGDDSTAAIPVDAIRLDIGLKDTVARAQRRVEDGQPMQIGELAVPNVGPQTLLSSRSGASTGPNLRRQITSQSQQSQQPSGAPRRANLPSGSVQRESSSQQPPMSARSQGVLALPRSARQEPPRPQEVPPLKLGTTKAKR